MIRHRPFAAAILLCALIAATASGDTPQPSLFDVRGDGDAWVAEARGILHRTQDAFFKAFAQAGFELQPAETLLTCYGFTDRAAYERYARKADGVNMSWTDGYYSARTNRIALYYGSPRSGSSHVNVHTNEDTLPVAGDSAWQMKLAHEAAHQLAFNTGLQSRGVMYPLWASEGLAAWFESCVSHELALDADNPDRRADLADILKREALTPLAELLTITRVPNRAQSISDVYAQSWAWFRFAISQEPEALERYFSAVAQLQTGSRARKTLKREIENAFGPIADLETRWKQYVTQLAALPMGTQNVETKKPRR